MRGLQIALTAVVLVSLVSVLGCGIISVHPFFTAQDVISDPALLGQWIYEDEAGTPACWEFTASEEDHYVLRNVDTEGLPHLFDAHLFALGGKRYLDICPGVLDESDPETALPKQNHLMALHTTVGHTLWQVELDGQVLELAGLDSDTLSTVSEDHPDLVEYTNSGEDEYGPQTDVIYSSSEQLRQFVLECGKSPDSFLVGQLLLSRKPNAGQDMALQTAAPRPAQITWRVLASTDQSVDCIPLPAGGAAFMNSRGEAVFLDASGKELARWQDSAMYYRSAAHFGDGRVYAATSDGIEAFLESGQQSWQAKLDGGAGSPKGVSSDGMMYALQCGNYLLTSYQPEERRIPARDSVVNVFAPDGSLANSFAASPGLLDCAAVSPAGVLYCGWISDSRTSFRIHAFSAAGTLSWSTSLPDEPEEVAISPDGTVIVAGYGGNLYALRPDGSQAWSFTQPDYNPWLADQRGRYFALASDGTVYTVSRRTLYALAPDGTLKWQLKLPRVLAAPLLGPDGRIYCQGQAGGVLEDMWASDDYGTHSRLIAVSPEGSMLAQWLLPEAVIIDGMGSQGEAYGIANAFEYTTDETGGQHSTPELVRIDLP